MTLYVEIEKVIQQGANLIVKAKINGDETFFSVPVGTTYGNLRNFIQATFVDEPLPSGWLRQFTI